MSLESALIMDFTPSSLTETGQEQPTTASNPKTEQSETKSLSFSLLLEPRSLLVIKGELYTHWKHGIEFRESDSIDASTITNFSKLSSEYQAYDGKELPRGSRRISMTIRVVNKVLKNVIFPLKK